MQETVQPQQPERLEIDKYERTYLILAFVMIGVFFAALFAGAIIYGVRPPTATAFVNPNLLVNTEFANPGLRDMGGGVYEAYIVARMWAYDAGSDETDALGRQIVRVPVGAQVTFNLTSADVQHGFYIEYHNINLQVLPGQVARRVLNFRTPGTFHVICHEYCGRGHQNMGMVIIVESANGAGA